MTRAATSRGSSPSRRVPAIWTTCWRVPAREPHHPTCRPSWNRRGWPGSPSPAYLLRQEVTVYLVSGQQVKDFRRFLKKHAKSDRVDARILAKLPQVNPEGIHRLRIADAPTLACQRACREMSRLSKQITAISNRLQAIDGFAWPGLHDLVFPDHLSPAARWFREHWYSPQQVLAAGAEAIRQAVAGQHGRPR